MRWFFFSAALLLSACTDCPTLHLDRGKLVWNEETIGEPALRTLEIENLCSDDEPVVVELQLVFGEPFSLRQSSVTVESGTPAIVEVVFTPPDDQPHVDTLLLYPGDLEQVEIGLEGSGTLDGI